MFESLHPSKEIDALWIKETDFRVSEINAGEVKVVPGEEVFKELKER